MDHRRQLISNGNPMEEIVGFSRACGQARLKAKASSVVSGSAQPSRRTRSD